MRRIVTILILTFFLYSTGISAHEGMIALYADPSPTSCQAILPELTMIDLSLFYIRGDGPHLGRCVEFRLLKSNDDIQLGGPICAEEHGLIVKIGDVESGLTICYGYGEAGWCFADEDYAFLGTVQVVNVADPDTFTVSVVKHPGLADPAINIIDCAYPNFSTIYEIIGGTFVFNGTCESPENPFQNPTPIQSSTWGAIKSMYR